MSGRLASPARIGLQPKAYWKCRISPNMTPAMAMEVPIWAAVAPRTVPLANTRRSSIGDARAALVVDERGAGDDRSDDRRRS